MPEIPPVIPGEFIFDTWGNPVARRTVQRYSDAADLATLNPTPEVGDVAYLLDTGVVQYWNGAVWDSGGALALTGGTMLGPLNMNAHTLNGLSDPTGGSGAVSQSYLNSQLLLPSGWVEVTLANGWEHFGSPVSYRKDAVGNLNLRGNMRNGTMTGGTVLFTITTPNRPPIVEFFPVASAQADSAAVSIDPSDGGVRLVDTVVLAAGYLSMSGIMYSTVP